MHPGQSKNTFTSIVITQAIAIFGFVLVPMLITCMAPRTTIELRRVNDVAAAKITRHTLLFVPIHVTEIAPIVDAEGIVKGVKYIRENRRKNQKAATQIPDGSVMLIGPENESRVQSTYEDAPVQAQLIKAFINNPAAAPQVITANAPWMLTYLLGGILTGFSVLYSVGAILAIARFFIVSILPAPESGETI